MPHEEHQNQGRLHSMLDLGHLCYQHCCSYLKKILGLIRLIGKLLLLESVSMARPSIFVGVTQSHQDKLPYRDRF